MLLKRLGQKARSFSTVNPLKSVIRFENQDQTWTWKDLDLHSTAFAYGLQELGFNSGDRLVTWFDRPHCQETVVAQMGALKTGVVLSTVQDESATGLRSAQENAKGCILSPNGRVADQKKSHLVQSIIPEIENLQNGLPLNSAAFPHLRVLIQTGFYTIPGFLKYKDMLVYANNNFWTGDKADGSPQQRPMFDTGAGILSSQEAMEDAKAFMAENELTTNDTLVVLSHPENSNTFARAALASYYTGLYSIYCGKEGDVNGVLHHVKNAVVIGDGSSKLTYTGDNIKKYVEL